MNRFRRVQSGFTLIELLIAAVCLVVVTVLVSGVLANALNAYAQNSYSRKVVDESQGAIDLMRQQIRQATYVTTGLFNNPLTSQATEPALVLTVPSTNTEGNGTYQTNGTPTAQDTVVFCTQYQVTGGKNTGQRLVEFRAIGRTSTLPTTIPAPTCQAASLNSYFGFGSSPQFGTYYLTDPEVKTVAVRFWPVAIAGISSPATLPPGVRVELVTQYDKANYTSSVLSAFRASDINRISPQLTLRTTIAREINSIGFTK